MGEWKFVGVSYDNISGEVKLWNDGVVEETANIGPGFEQGTQHTVRMGVVSGDSLHFRGRISHVGVYNVALTQEQILEIKGKNVRHKYDTSFFFLAPRVLELRCTEFRTHIFFEGGWGGEINNNKHNNSDKIERNNNMNDNRKQQEEDCHLSQCMKFKQR